MFIVNNYAFGGPFLFRDDVLLGLVGKHAEARVPELALRAFLLQDYVIGMVSSAC